MTLSIPARWAALLSILAALIAPSPARADAPPAITSTPTVVVTAPPAVTAPPVATVAAVPADDVPLTTVTSVTVREPAPRSYGCLGDVAIIEMANGDVEKLRHYGASKGRGLAIFFDGQQLKGLTPAIVSAAEKDLLRLELQRTDENRAAWGSLLGGRAFKRRGVLVRVGLDDGTPLSRAAVFTLDPLPHRSGGVLIAMSVTLLIALFTLGRRTTLLRDGRTPDGSLGTFSLSRTQAAFWFAHIVIAFLWIWAVTGEADTITESSLMLLGIGSSTALGAALIDKNKGVEKPAPVLPSAGLLDDLLTDEDGYTLHRFQMLIWSVVLSILFWTTVYKRLAMPDFDGTVLGLMGISSGTYLGFKLPERRSADKGAASG